VKQPNWPSKGQDGAGAPGVGFTPGAFDVTFLAQPLRVNFSSAPSCDTSTTKLAIDRISV